MHSTPNYLEKKETVFAGEYVEEWLLMQASVSGSSVFRVYTF